MSGTCGSAIPETGTGEKLPRIRLVLGYAVFLRSDRTNNSMKVKIFVGLCGALCWQAMGQTNTASTNSTNSEPSAFLAGMETTNDIATADGAIYRNVRVERVEPDGLTVRYIPLAGGLGIVKIKFDELANEWRQQYGFDPEKKLAYEKEQKLAAAWWRAQMITNYEAAMARHQAHEQAEAEAEAKAKEELEKVAAAGEMTVTNPPGNITVTNQLGTDMTVTNQSEANVIQPPQ
jgi:hypothetical protein